MVSLLYSYTRLSCGELIHQESPLKIWPYHWIIIFLNCDGACLLLILLATTEEVSPLLAYISLALALSRMMLLQSLGLI